MKSNRGINMSVYRRRDKRNDIFREQLLSISTGYRRKYLIRIYLDFLVAKLSIKKVIKIK